MADITYMGIRHWSTIKQRPQHLAEGLAQIDRVIYVNPVGLWRFGKACRTLGEDPRRVGSGKVVVATAMRELRLLGKVCYVASDHDSFVTAVGRALAEAHDPARHELMRCKRR